jgi:hypothetical protein
MDRPPHDAATGADPRLFHGLWMKNFHDRFLRGELFPCFERQIRFPFVPDEQL